MSAALKSTISEAEYLLIDRAAEVRSEYDRGVLIAMAGASRDHNRINENLSGELHRQLRGKPCQSFSRDLRVKIDGQYVYPDAVIVCGEPTFADDRQDILLNPQAVFEILSDSSEERDRGRKFRSYLRLPSLTDYVLIDQRECRVEQFSRDDDGNWRYRVLTKPTDLLNLPSAGVSLELADLYDRVTWEPSAGES